MTQLDFSSINSYEPGRTKSTFKLGKKIFEKKKKKSQKNIDNQHKRGISDEINNSCIISTDF